MTSALSVRSGVPGRAAPWGTGTEECPRSTCRRGGGRGGGLLHYSCGVCGVRVSGTWARSCAPRTFAPAKRGPEPRRGARKHMERRGAGGGVRARASSLSSREDVRGRRLKLECREIVTETRCSEHRETCQEKRQTPLDALSPRKAEIWSKRERNVPFCLFLILFRPSALRFHLTC